MGSKYAMVVAPHQPARIDQRALLMNRRHVLAIGILTACAGIAQRAVAAVLGQLSPPPSAAAPPAGSASFAAWLDTLLPGDARSPSASAIGVAPAVSETLVQQAGGRRVHDAGIQWLDAQARARGAATYAALGEAARETVATTAAASPPGSLPNVFFILTRDEAFKAYYADPRTWPGAGYLGPPQPDGFERFSEPPADIAHGR